MLLGNAVVDAIKATPHHKRSQPSDKEVYIPMITFPGWESLEATSNWTFGLHIAAVAFALLLGLSEFLAFVYGKRADTLRAIAESASAEQRKREIDETNSRHEAEVTEL